MEDSGLLGCAAVWVVPDILKEPTAPILKGQGDKKVPLGPLAPPSDAVLTPEDQNPSYKQIITRKDKF